MYRQIWYNQPYLRFASFISRKAVEGGVEEVAPIGDLKDSAQITPTKMPIQIMEEFSGKEGGTSMMIPVKTVSKGRPVIGDDTLSGKEERNNFIYKTVRINRIRHGENVKAGVYNEQKIKKYVNDLMNQAEPSITDWYRRYINTSMIKRALFEGRSYEITAAAPHGRAIAKVSHPNMFVTGYGFVPYTAGKPATANYEISVETALNTLGVGDSFSMGMIEALDTMMPRQKRIMPSVITSQGEYYICIITPAQYYQIRTSAEWKTIATAVLPREQDEKLNWLLNGRVGCYGSLLFYVDIQGWGAHTNANPNGWATAPTAGSPAFGVEDAGGYDFPDMALLDDSNFQCGFILGAGGALNLGIAKKLGFEFEERDYKSIKNVGGDMMAGCERGDMYDSDGQLAGNTALDFQENTSSIQFVTYSPMPTGV